MREVNIRCPECHRHWKVTGLAKNRRSVACPHCRRMVVLAKHAERSHKRTIAGSDIAFWGTLSGVIVLAIGLVIGAGVAGTSSTPSRESQNPTVVTTSQTAIPIREPGVNSEPKLPVVAMNVPDTPQQVQQPLQPEIPAKGPPQPFGNPAPPTVVATIPTPVVPSGHAIVPTVGEPPANPKPAIASSIIVARSRPDTRFSDDPKVIAERINRSNFDPRRFKASVDHPRTAPGFDSLISRSRRR